MATNSSLKHHLKAKKEQSEGGSTVSDNKKYYYLKLKDNFFDSEEIKVLESCQNGIYYSNLLMKLYLKSLKFNGALRFNEFIPYDENMIAAITNLNIDIVRSGLKILSSVRLIERLDDGTIYMMNIQSFIGKSNSEADRKRLYREKIEQEKLLIGQMSEECPKDNGTISDKHPPEIEKEIEIELEIERDTAVDKSQIDSQSVSLLKSFEKETGLIGKINLNALKKAVEIHGKDYVKKAMDKAVERNKPTMVYINGILKNWAKEGYPKEGEENGNGSTGKNNESAANKFAGFRAKEPRKLSEEERSLMEAELL